ncbi:MAG: hypothetical protein FWE37_00175 [Spirochaetaceae bacterium]|nr:hypothetical protein [Spirochaetaceae bacterium]
MLKINRIKIYRFGLSILGAIIIGLGIGLAAGSGYGADAMGFLYEGVSLHLPLNFGQSALAVMLVMTAIVFIIDKKQLGLSTIINPFFTALFTEMAFKFAPASNLALINFLLMLVGLTLIGAGAALVALSYSGKDSYTALVFALYGRFKKLGLARARMLCEAIFYAVALLLGTGFKIGPFMGVIIIGPILRLVYIKADKLPFLLISR